MASAGGDCWTGPPGRFQRTCWLSLCGDAQLMRSWLGWAARATCTPRGRSLSAKGTTAVASTLNSLMHHSLRSPQEKSTTSASLPMFVIWKR